MITELIKRILWDHIGISEIESIKDAISTYEYVSFDIYDTLIRRAVPEPEDVFLLLAKQISEEDSDSFRDQRIIAGKKAREKANKNGIAEVTLSDIYDCMPSPYKEKKEWLMEMEKLIELNICFPDPIMKKIYDWCVCNNKTIAFVSDMYLPYEVIKRMLKKCGYETYDVLLLSCKEGKTKRNGKLYDSLIEIWGFPDKIVHIGDHYRSDWLKARANGIHAIKIPRIPCRTTFCMNSKKACTKKNYVKLKKILNYNSDFEFGFFHKYGFECLGPVLAGTSVHLHEMMKSKKYDRVFFLSRDGYMIKQVYDRLYTNDNHIGEYMYISRKSIQFPLLCSYDNVQDYLLLNGERKVWNYKMFCNRVGIDSKKALADWLNMGLNEQYRFHASQIKSDERIMSFYNLYKDYVQEQSTQAASIVIDYLKQIHFAGNVLIVDTGGYGTTQRCLAEFCRRNGLDVNITGAYLWVFDNPNLDTITFPYMESTSHGGETQITELPLTAHEGTTEAYRKNSINLIEPVLGIYEYSKHPEMENAINEIQNGAIKFADLYRNCLDLDFLDYRTSYNNTKRISRRPRLKEARMFGDLIFLSDHQENYLAKPKRTLQYLRNFKSLKEDFKASNWKIGFLKRLFKLPLPYYEIISFARNYKKHF